MNVIRSDSIGEAWIKLMRLVMKDGHEIHDDKRLLKEYLNLCIIMNNIPEEDEIIEKYGSEEILKFIDSNFLSKEPREEWGYSYGSRIFNYNGVNQLEKVVNKLKEKPESKSATISLMNPEEDEKHTPCSCVLDFKLRSKGLITACFFRSQDVGKKFYADAVSIHKLSKRITKELEEEMDKIVFFVTSAHIYEDDFNNLKRVLKEKQELQE